MNETLTMILLLACLLILPSTLHSYNDVWGHPQITREICLFYNRSAPPTQQLTAGDIACAARGAHDEDHPTDRSLNHFLNPLTRKGWSLRFPIQALERAEEFPFVPDSAWDGHKRCGSFAPTFIPFGADEWVMNPWAQQTHPYCENASWQEGVNAMERGDRMRAMTILGHVLHLLEDLTVPDHTRNDPHVYGANFENFVKEKLKKMQTDHCVDPAILTTITPIDVDDIRHCFLNVAFYTATHFLSNDTLRARDHPVPPFIRIQKELNWNPTRAYLMAKDDDGSVYHVARIPGIYVNTTILPSGVPVVPLHSTLDEIVFEDTWIRAVRNCCRYGAGIIRLFVNETSLMTTIARPRSIVFIARYHRVNGQERSSIISLDITDHTSTTLARFGRAWNMRWDNRPTSTLLVNGGLPIDHPDEDNRLGTYAIDLASRSITRRTSAIEGADTDYAPNTSYAPFLGSPIGNNRYAATIDIPGEHNDAHRLGDEYGRDSVVALVDGSGRVVSHLTNPTNSGCLDANPVSLANGNVIATSNRQGRDRIEPMIINPNDKTLNLIGLMLDGNSVPHRTLAGDVLISYPFVHDARQRDVIRIDRLTSAVSHLTRLPRPITPTDLSTDRKWLLASDSDVKLIDLKSNETMSITSTPDVDEVEPLFVPQE